jgi:hypothetical protein
MNFLGERILSPLNYIPYDEEEAMRILEKDYGWRYYGGKHYESRWTRFFQGFYLPHKFGYDKRKAHLASLVLAGQMSRDTAFKELKRLCILVMSLPKTKPSLPRN